jgi:hypothetical protein
LTGGDRSVTATFTTPASNGYDISGYEINYTYDDGTNWTGWSAAVSPQTNAAYNGFPWKVKIRATNAIGTSAESALSNAVTPTFAAPTISAADLTGFGDVNNSATWYKRPVRATVSPTACVNYLTTTISLRITDNPYMDTKYGEPFTASTANQTSDFYTYTQWGSSYNIGLSNQITVTATTYNTDNYSRSASFSYITSPGNLRLYDTSTEWTTDTIQVTGGSMARAYFDWWGTINESVRSAIVYGKISGTASTVSAGRNPSIGLSSATSSTGTGGDIVNMRALNGNVSWPSGPTERNYTWNNTNLNTSFNTTGTGGSLNFAQRYSVAGDGDGTLTGTWVAAERINVRLTITYLYRSSENI